MATTNKLKNELIKQIIESGSNMPLSALNTNFDILISTAKIEALQSIETCAIGQHITEPIEPLTDPQL